MAQIKQPSFWLEVKKEYITENFDSLCKYLKAYRYIKEQEHADSDFNKTFNCLKDVVYDYFGQTNECSLFKKPSEVLKVEIPFAVRLIATYIFVSFEKKKEVDYHAIINLVNILILEEKIKDNIKKAIKDVIINCICRKTINNLSYSWDNLELIKSNDSLSTMASFLANIKFDDNQVLTFKYEGKGLVVLDNMEIHVAAMNYRTYQTNKLKVNPFIMRLPYNIDILHDDNTSYNSFNILDFILNKIEDKQNKVIPVTENTLCYSQHEINKEESLNRDDIFEELNSLARSIYQLTINHQQPEEKYQLLHVVYMLFKLTENEKEQQFVKFDKDYLYCLAKFAQGENPQDLKLVYDDNMELTQSMRDKIETIKKLNEYIDNKSVDPNKTADDKDLLGNLIKASNTLIGEINPKEIERIKKRIAFNLGVSDVYVDKGDKINYYGEESITLEFKKSFVFPPNSLADLRVQKYNVLKAICGMLNNQGGEVLLGVDNDGYASGLDDDLKELYKLKKIKVKTLDQLRLYISQQIEKAFINKFDKREKDEQITKELIECNVDNDVKIIRISIKPYKFGVVMFKDNNEVPDNVRASAFYRKSGQTVKLNETECGDINNEKRSKLDPNTIKMRELKKSFDLKKVAILKNYRSGNSEEIRNRTVEAYQFDEVRKSAICYCHDRKAPREFKITRFDEVEITEIDWKYNKYKHPERKIDVFDMHENSEIKPIKIILKLKHSAYNLLIEDYERSEKCIKENKEDDKKEFPYILKTEVYNIIGVGRFYLGLAQAIKIVQGDELKEFAKNYIKGSSLLD